MRRQLFPLQLQRQRPPLRKRQRLQLRERQRLQNPLLYQLPPRYLKPAATIPCSASLKANSPSVRTISGIRPNPWRPAPPVSMARSSPQSYHRRLSALARKYFALIMVRHGRAAILVNGLIADPLRLAPFARTVRWSFQIKDGWSGEATTTAVVVLGAGRTDHSALPSFSLTIFRSARCRMFRCISS